MNTCNMCQPGLHPNCDSVEICGDCALHHGVSIHGCGNPMYNVYSWDRAHPHCHHKEPVVVHHLCDYLTKGEAERDYVNKVDYAGDSMKRAAYIENTYSTKVENDVLDQKIEAEAQDRQTEDTALRGRMDGYKDQLQRDINSATAAISSEITRAQQAEQVLTNSVNVLRDTLVKTAEYNASSKKIIFKNTAGQQIAAIDATQFVKDGMVSNVILDGDYLVIEFNTDSGKSDIRIKLSDFINPNMYYDRSYIDTALDNITDAINNINGALNTINTQLNDRYTKSYIDSHFVTVE